MFPKLHKLSVNLAEKINVPHHSDSHCRCMGNMISSTSVPFDEQSSAMKAWKCHFRHEFSEEFSN